MDVDKGDKKKGMSPTIIVCLILLVIGAGFLLWPSTPQTNPVVGSSICSQISGTPAWVQNDKIIGYGEQFVERTLNQEFNDVVNDYLIPNKIVFVWDPKCIHCHNEINRFGSSWQKYLDSGLTLECHIL